MQGCDGDWNDAKSNGVCVTACLLQGQLRWCKPSLTLFGKRNSNNSCRAILPYYSILEALTAGYSYFLTMRIRTHTHTAERVRTNFVIETYNGEVVVAFRNA